MSLATVALVTMLLVVAGGLSVTSAFAGETAWWQLSTSAKPTVLDPGSEATLIVRAVNLGNTAVGGVNVPVAVSDTLPAGITAVSARGVAGFDNLSENEAGDRGPMTCTTGTTVTCTWSGPEPLEPYETLELYIKVDVGTPAAGVETAATISGGEAYLCTASEYGKYSGPFCRETEARPEEAPGGYESSYSGTAVPSASNSHPLTLAASANEATPFGVSNFEVTPESEGGSLDTQAGSHPFQLTTSVAFNESSTAAKPPAFTKNVKIKLPPGLIGNAQGIPQCTEAEFAETFAEGGNSNLCPNDSAVGVASVSVAVHISGFGLVPLTLAVPVFNLVPARGEPARFGFEVEKAPVVIDTSVRTGTDYGITASVSNITQFAVFNASDVTLWGVPGEASHRLSRGWSCVDGGFFREREELLPTCSATGEAKPRPFLRMPTSCTGPLESAVEVDSWQESESAALRHYTPGEFGHQSDSQVGCERLPFSPQFSFTTNPQSPTTSTPTGLTVKIRQPQEANENPKGLATADIKDATVALPSGFTINAASANGLEACSEEQVGFVPALSGGGQKIFTATLPSPSCPAGAKVGTVKIKVPVLANPLEGAVYLATQEENPFDSLIALYIVAEDPVSGVLVKLPGEVSLDEGTGRVTATFENTPQAPIEELEVSFFGGPLAALSTPTHCGSYVTKASFTPWSGSASVSSEASSQVSSGVGGSACPGQLPFAPAFTAGTTSNKAGSFSPLTTALSREDGSQNIESVTLKLPPGLAGLLSSVKLCQEGEVAAGTCGPESLIGHTTVSVGVGSNPVTVSGGQVFITGPYGGAPFGLSIVVPAKAGPFNLGTVTVRAALAIDPHTAAVTVTTGPIPQMLKGIPIQIKHVSIAIDRPGFAVNPTDCSPTAITGSVHGSEGTSAPVSVSFNVVNCSSLAFAPKLTATVGALATKPNGVSFVTKLTYPATPQGTEADVAKVKVDLPIQLPTRDSTLQQACVAAVFEANPALCPAGSIVGHATAATPLLPVPLIGPAYFVSHGGEAFPSLTVVLQGDGVTYYLVGNTLIRKGITSTSFKSVADVPISSFELTLPTGKYSALTSNLPIKDKGNFCGQKLVMPTAIIGQNGAEIHESTPIAVAGCPKAKVKKAKKKAKAHKTVKHK
jgi:uncharacterized repeat protein (TIGR01451 family)